MLGWVSKTSRCCVQLSRWMQFLTRLATFSRVILFDKRGTVFSDRISDMPPAAL